MDNSAIYGPEFHRLGYGQAVEHDLLADYNVLSLTVSGSMPQHTINLDSPTNLQLNLDNWSTGNSRSMRFRQASAWMSVYALTASPFRLLTFYAT